MSETENTLHVEDGELLARFIVFNSWVRKDNTVKSDAFIPHSLRLDLSVTRHLELTDQKIWNIGQEVAKTRNTKLVGRADIIAKNVRNEHLEIKPDDIPKNHANIINWPQEKPFQKSIAQKLAASAQYKAAP